MIDKSVYKYDGSLYGLTKQLYFNSEWDKVILAEMQISTTLLSTDTTSTGAPGLSSFEPEPILVKSDFH